MSGEVVHLAGREGGARDETILGFVAREGAVTTYSVSCRFGLTLGEARKRLKRLEAGGLLLSRKENFSYCAMYVWSATEKPAR